MQPDVAVLTVAMARLADPDERAQMAEGARATREHLSWARTVEDYGKLLDSVPALAGTPSKPELGSAR
jgi:glycosyltransferase involved in cell wall biosynthesis